MAFDPMTAALDIGGKLIDRLWPDPTQASAAKLQLLSMQQSGELAQITAAADQAKAQLAVDAAEASSSSAFTSGWRPAIGWVCASAMAFQYLVRPIVIATHPALPLPGIDDNLWQLMLGMLGLGGLRSFEKVKGVTK